MRVDSNLLSVQVLFLDLLLVVALAACGGSSSGGSSGTSSTGCSSNCQLTSGETENFPGPVNYAVGTNPVAVAVADFNGDGRQDLAVANKSSNNVSILLGNGDGTFQKAANYAVGPFPSFGFLVEMARTRTGGKITVGGHQTRRFPLADAKVTHALANDGTSEGQIVEIEMK